MQNQLRHVTVFAASAPLVALAFVAALGLRQEPAPTTPTPTADVEVYELTVRREPKATGATLFGNAGVDIKIAVQVPGASLLALDEEKTKLAKWTDDQGTDLTPSDDNFFFWASMDGRWSDEPRMDLATLTLHTDQLPVSAAGRVVLESTLVFVDASDLTTTDTSVVMTKGTKFQLAGVDVKLADVTDMEGSDTYVQQIEIQSSRALDALQSLVFKDAEGNVIESDGMGSGSMSMFGKRTYSYYYGLARKVDAATLTATYYARMGTVEVPLRLSLGVGF